MNTMWVVVSLTNSLQNTQGIHWKVSNAEVRTISVSSLRQDLKNIWNLCGLKPHYDDCRSNVDRPYYSRRENGNSYGFMTMIVMASKFVLMDLFGDKGEC